MNARRYLRNIRNRRSARRLKPLAAIAVCVAALGVDINPVAALAPPPARAVCEAHDGRALPLVTVGARRVDGFRAQQLTDALRCRRLP